MPPAVRVGRAIVLDIARVDHGAGNFSGAQFGQAQARRTDGFEAVVALKRQPVAVENVAQDHGEAGVDGVRAEKLAF